MTEQHAGGLVVGPPAKNIAMRTHEGMPAYIITFEMPLTGDQLGVAADLAASVLPDGVMQWRLDERDWFAIHAHGDDEDLYVQLRGLAEVFKPSTELTAAGVVSQGTLAFEARFEILNFDGSEDPDRLDELVKRLRPIKGILAVERVDGQIAMQVAGRFEERHEWLQAALAEHINTHVTLYDFHKEFSRRLSVNVLRRLVGD